MFHAVCLKVVTTGKDEVEGTAEEKQKVKTFLETLSPSHPTRQEDDETTGVSCPFRDRASCLFFFPGVWLADRGVWPVSSELPFQSLMTDLKDSSLSPLLQITSFDMLGHADNVLSENSFQGWMGYKLSTPRVGYFFNCCFIPLKKVRKRNQRETERQTDPKQSRDYHKAKDNEASRIKAAWIIGFFGFIIWHGSVFSLSLSALKTCKRREGTGCGRGVSLLTQTGKNAWTVFLCCCDWIHFCGLDCVFRSRFRSLHVMCVVGLDRFCVCSLYLQVWNHWAEHIVLCVWRKSCVLCQCGHKRIIPSSSTLSQNDLC